MSPTELIGFHSTYFSSLNHTDLKQERRGMAQRNIFTALGYLPIVAIITGVIGLVLSGKAMNQKNYDKTYHAVHITRRVLEIFGLGLLFLIPDLLVTAGRVSKASVKAMRQVHDAKWQITTSTPS